MRIRVLSDLHLEVEPWDPPPADADVVVLAGDIDNGRVGVEWAAYAFDAPVVFVPGNHEYYDGEHGAASTAIRGAAARTGVTLLDPAECVIHGVRFLGCTLWTDFELPLSMERHRAIELARKWITDFRAIRFGDRLLTLEDTLALHQAHRDWLAARLGEPHPGPTVVVTHHAPHPGSVAPKFRDHPVNPGFVSDLDALMGVATLWIHGHTHNAFDYEVRGTRIVCNPRGYPGERTGFDPSLVVEI